MDPSSTPRPRAAQGASTEPARVLVRGVNWLGDAVMTTPALLRLRERFPNAHISLLTADKLADLWGHHPAIDAILAFAPDESLGRIARQLRRDPFDLGIVLPNSPRSALELWWSGVPRRIGYRRPWRNWLLTETVRPREHEIPMRKRSAAVIRRLVAGGSGEPAGEVPRLPMAAHHLHQYLHLVAAVGADPTPVAPLLHLSGDERRTARALVVGLGQTEGLGRRQRWLGLNPGAEYGPAKRWPTDRFAAVANEVSRQLDCGWLIFGGSRDQTMAGEIARAVPTAVSLAGRTTLRQLMVALTSCELLLTNDTGPMHLAAALGTPVMALFGSTSPELTGPGLPGDIRHRLLKSRVPCSPCFRRECPIDHRCMKEFESPAVAQEILTMLASRR
ncbi:MAG: lipopolysaccharide heptosyltransferase II [Limisphaerales bacterium]